MPRRWDGFQSVVAESDDLVANHLVGEGQHTVEPRDRLRLALEGDTV